MCSWAPDDERKPGVTLPLGPLLVACVVGALLWLLLAGAVWLALLFAGWNGAR